MNTRIYKSSWLAGPAFGLIWLTCSSPAQTAPANLSALQVTIDPPGAVSAGAQWEVDDGGFQPSGAVVSSLSAGVHAVVFKTISGWSTPASQIVSVTAGATNQVSGTYVLWPTYLWAHNALGQEFQHCTDLYPQYWPSNSSWTQTFTTGSGCAPDSTVETEPANWDPADTNTTTLNTNAYAGLFPGGPGLQGVNVILGPDSLAAGTYMTAQHVQLNNLTMQAESSLGFSYSIAVNRIEFQGDGTLAGGQLILANGGTLFKSGGTNAYFVNGDITATNDLLAVDSGTLALPSGYGNADFMGTTTIAVATNATLLLTVDSGAEPFFSGTVMGVGTGTVLFNTGAIGSEGCNLDFPGTMFQWTGGSLEGGYIGGPCTNSGVMNLTNSPGIYGGTLYNNGLINLADNSALFFSGSGGTIDNDPAGIFNIQGNSSLIGGGAFYNYGWLTKSGGAGTAQINSTMNNYGGIIEADAGTLALNVKGAGYYTNVTFVVSNGATIDFLTSNYNQTVEGNLAGIGGGTVLLNNGTVSSVYSHTTLNFPGAMFQWQGGKFGNFTNIGSLNVSGPVGIDAEMANNGSIIQSGTGSIGSGNALFNNPGGVYDLQNDNGISVGTIYNNGLYKKSAGTGTSPIAASFLNYGPTGTVEVDSGTLAIGDSSGNLFTNTSLTVSNGAVLILVNNNELEGMATGSGGGAVWLTNGTAYCNHGAILNFPGTMFQWQGGQIGNSVTSSFLMTNTGVLNINGPVAVNGYLDNAGTMTQSGAGAMGNGTLQNTGIYDVQNDNGLALNNLNNYGLIKKSAGSGTSQINAINSFYSAGGTIEVDSGALSLANGGYFFTNTSSFVVSNGATLILNVGNYTKEVEGSLIGYGAGTILMTNGTLYCNHAATLDFPGSMFQWQGGSIGNNPTSSPLLTNLGTLNISGPVNLNGYLANDGTVIQSGVGAMKSGGSGFKNDSLYQIQNDNGVTNGYFNNYGRLAKTAGTGTSVIYGPFYNYGAVQATTGNIQFNGGEFDQDAGTLQLTPAITFGAAQNLYLRAGTLTGVGTLGYSGGSVFVNGGTLVPGNPFGTIHLPGNNTYLNSGGTLNIALGGPSEFGQLAVNNHIQLGGTLVVTLTNGYTPAIGTQFEVITNGSTGYSFAAATLPQGIALTYSNTGVYLTVTSAVPAQVRSPQLSGGYFGFSFGTVTGQSYTIQQNTNLDTTIWTTDTNITGNGLPYEFTTPFTNIPQLFFRVREP